jgi:hypothetical protein
MDETSSSQADDLENTPIELSPADYDVFAGLGKLPTMDQIKLRLADLGYTRKISSKLPKDALLQLLHDYEKEISLAQRETMETVFNTPLKSSENFTGSNPSIFTSEFSSPQVKAIDEAFAVLTNQRLVRAGHYDILTTLLETFGLHDRATMDQLVTMPDFMEEIAELLSPIGKRIFLRAIPGHTPDSPSMITSSSIKKTKSSREMRDMKVQLATIVANLSKVTDLVTSPAKSVVPELPALIIQKIQELPRTRPPPQVKITSVEIPPAVIASLTASEALNLALAAADADILVAEAEYAAYQATITTPPVPSTDDLLLSEKLAKAASIRANYADLRAASVPPTPSDHQLMLNKVAASTTVGDKLRPSAVAVPIPRVPGIHKRDDDDDDDDDDCDDGDNRDDGDSDADGSGDSKHRGKTRASAALLRKGSARAIAKIRDYWDKNSSNSYRDITLALGTKAGLRVVTSIGGVFTGKFQKSVKDAGKARYLQALELYGPPGDIRPSEGGLSCCSAEDRIIFPQSHSEINKLIEQETSLLMKYKGIDNDTKAGWLEALHDLKIKYNASARSLMGSTPNNPEKGWIQKTAGSALFMFNRIQLANSSRDFTLLNAGYDADWDRTVKPLANGKLGNDITSRQFQDILAVLGHVCSNSVCGAAGMTEAVCGACVRPTSAKSHRPPPDFYKRRNAAKAAFKATHPALTTERDLSTAFDEENPDLVWHLLDKGQAAEILTRGEALQYIFSNQDKIELPFHLA